MKESTMETRRKASSKYQKANTVTYSLVLNLKTDADIIEHLSHKENRLGYLKELIRKDLR